MITIGRGKSTTCTGVTRRDFLRVGGLGLGSLGFSQAELAAAMNPASSAERSVILLLLVGGPSQLETWDPKPGVHGGGQRTIPLDRDPLPRRSDLRAPAWFGVEDGPPCPGSIRPPRRGPDP